MGKKEELFLNMNSTDYEPECQKWWGDPINWLSWPKYRCVFWLDSGIIIREVGFVRMFVCCYDDTICILADVYDKRTSILLLFLFTLMLLGHLIVEVNQIELYIGGGK